MLTILQKSPIIPVIVIEDANLAVPLAQAILAGGISVLEITLRTSAALEAIKLINQQVPQAIVGAGTVLTSDQLKQAKVAGASFAVSPGLSVQLINTANEMQLPYLPGIVTASEAMLAQQLKLPAVKFFPAESFGGVKTLKAFSQVFPQLQFCPTGGVSLQNMKDYLALANVPAVGGTWFTPVDLITQQNWSAITQLVKQALDLLKRKS